MGRGDRLGEKVRGSSGGKYPGRVSGCDKIPGLGACFKQMHGSRDGKCRHCQAPEVQTERMKVFGR